MLRAFAAVGGYTLLSRVTGFIRDVVTAALLGAGPVADAFLVAFRLPNHFRSLFAEGAFQAAFVPSYTGVLVNADEARARAFARSVLTLLMAASLGVALLLAVFPKAAIDVLAPGISADAERFGHAATYLRITAAYLACMSLVAFYSGLAAARENFAAAAAAPILLNLCMIAGIVWLTRYVPDAGWSLSAAVMISGVLQAALVAWAAWRVGGPVLPGLVQPSKDLTTFFARLGPAILGSGVVQISAFVDTIIASFLPVGAIAHLYYADRLYQLPYGVIGLALGTVILPTLSRAFAAEDHAAARAAFARAAELALLLGLPVTLVLAVASRQSVSALFGYGIFNSEDIALSAPVVAAYALGLPAGILLRTIVPAFQAKGDTVTPVKVGGAVLVVSIALKIALIQRLGAAGIAAATAIAAWINLIGLGYLMRRRAVVELDPRLKGIGWRLALATLLGAGALLALFQRAEVADVFASRIFLHKTLLLAAIGTGVLIFYALVLAATRYRHVSVLLRK